MFFSKQTSYLGVDFGAHGIKIVELKKEKNRPVLFTYGSSSQKKNIHKLFSNKEKTMEDLVKNKNISTSENMVIEVPGIEDPKQVDLYAADLKAMCKACKTVSTLATASLPISAVFHTVINLPPMDKKEFDITLKAQIKKLLPLPIEEMALDYQIIKNGNGKNQRVIVNAVNKKLVTFYTQVFTKAGLTLEALEPESTALARSLVGKDEAVTMVIDMGAERTNFFIIDKGAPITHHSLVLGGDRIDVLIQKNLGINEEDIEQVKADLFRFYNSAGKNSLDKEKFLTLLNPVLDPIIKQIEYGFDVYLHQTGNEEKKPEKIILTGGAAVLPYLAQFLAEKFKLRCFLGDPWARLVYQEKLKPVLNEMGPRMSVAIGLAMRKIV